MPRGVTPIRQRRRQSDAKWRASVSMCYNIMKTVIPNQKKMGRRKLSKALTLKETERHIVTLERKLREIIEERAPRMGHVVMMEKEGECLSPATFEHVKQDFASKQYYNFNSTGTNTGKKRYNIPADIEMSLENLSHQSCSLVTVPRSEVENSYPGLCQGIDTSRNKVQSSTSSGSKLCHLLTQPLDSDDFDYNTTVTTPSKKRGRPASTSTRVKRAYIRGAPSTADKKEMTKITPLKACTKQLPFTTEATPSKTSQSRPCKSTGFTPVKLPYGLDKDTVLGIPPTSPVMSMIGSPMNYFTMLETPGSGCFHGVESLEMSEDEGTSLLCTESIDSMDLDLQISKIQEYEAESPIQTAEVVELTKCRVDNFSGNGNLVSEKGSFSSRCRRRLDKDYGYSEQEVPESDRSCLDFDGYLLFHEQNVECVDTGPSSPETAHSLAQMWQTLGDDDRAVYARMAKHNNSPVLNDQSLSEDLVDIDLKPLQGVLQAESNLAHDDVQEVPSMSLDLSIGDIQRSMQLNMVPGYEDLGVFYTNENIKQDYNGEETDDAEVPYSFEDDSCQVVPDMY